MTTAPQPAPRGGGRRVTRERLKTLAALAGGVAFGFVLVVLVINAVIGFLVGHGEAIEVPDLAGLGLRDAQARLAPLGLGLTVKSERPSSLFPAGCVASQNPKPTARVKPGRRIEVIVSTGIDAVAVPSVGGVTLREAGFRLLEEGLEAGDTVRIPSEDAPAERVLATSPGAGTRVARGERVALLVSQGPPRAAFLMPDLTGLQLDDVAALLRDAGFAVGEVRMEKDRRVRKGTVVVQRPGPGSRVLEGDAVDLVVAGR